MERNQNIARRRQYNKNYVFQKMELENRTGWVGSSEEAIVCREAGEVKKIGKGELGAKTKREKRLWNKIEGIHTFLYTHAPSTYILFLFLSRYSSPSFPSPSHSCSCDKYEFCFHALITFTNVPYICSGGCCSLMG